jgi:hypothetical protein
MFAKSGWSFFLSWVAIACSKGHGGLINTFLSWGVFQEWDPYSTHFESFTKSYNMKGKSFLRLEANDSGLSQLGFSLLDLESLVSLLQGVDYTCVLDEQFGCAFHCLILFTRHFFSFRH